MFINRFDHFSWTSQPGLQGKLGQKLFWINFPPRYGVINLIEIIQASQCLLELRKSLLNKTTLLGNINERFILKLKTLQYSNPPLEEMFVLVSFKQQAQIEPSNSFKLPDALTHHFLPWGPKKKWKFVLN